MAEQFAQIAKWLMVALMAFSALATVAAIGKPREPLTHKVAVGVVVLNAASIAAILTWWS